MTRTPPPRRCALQAKQQAQVTAVTSVSHLRSAWSLCVHRERLKPAAASRGQPLHACTRARACACFQLCASTSKTAEMATPWTHARDGRRGRPIRVHNHLQPDRDAWPWLKARGPSARVVQRTSHLCTIALLETSLLPQTAHTPPLLHLKRALQYTPPSECSVKQQHNGALPTVHRPQIAPCTAAQRAMLPATYTRNRHTKIP